MNEGKLDFKGHCNAVQLSALMHQLLAILCCRHSFHTKKVKKTKQPGGKRF